MDKDTIVLSAFMIATICIYLYRVRNIGKYWKNFLLEMFVFVVVTHMVEGVTGMKIALIVNMVFIIFAHFILKVTGFSSTKKVK